MKLVLCSMVALLSVYTVYTFEENDAKKKEHGTQVHGYPSYGGYGGYYFNPYTELLEVKCQLKRNIKAMENLLKKKPVPFDLCAYQKHEKKSPNPYYLAKEINYLIKYLLHKQFIVLKITGHNYQYIKNLHRGYPKYDQEQNDQQDPGQYGHDGGYGYGFGINWYAILESINYQLDYNNKIIYGVIKKQMSYGVKHDEEQEDPAQGKVPVKKPSLYHLFEEVHYKVNQNLVVMMAELVKRGGFLYYH